MKKYEYIVKELEYDENLQNAINEMARDGYKVISVVFIKDKWSNLYYTVVFERELQS